MARARFPHAIPPRVGTSPLTAADRARVDQVRRRMLVVGNLRVTRVAVSLGVTFPVVTGPVMTDLVVTDPVGRSAVPPGRARALRVIPVAAILATPVTRAAPVVPHAVVTAVRCRHLRCRVAAIRIAPVAGRVDPAQRRVWVLRLARVQRVAMSRRRTPRIAVGRSANRSC